MTCPSARFWEVTRPQEMLPAHLVGVISLDVPEGAGGRLAKGAAGQGRLQCWLFHQQCLWLCQGLLDDDGSGGGCGAGSGSHLRHRLLLHLHFGVVEILLPLPLVRVCAVPAREKRGIAVKRQACLHHGEDELLSRAALLPGSKASRQL